MSPEKFDDVKANVQDPLQDMNLGTAEYPRPTYIIFLLVKMIHILLKFESCFAWDYTEMPGLSRELVEHRLPPK